MFCTIPLFQGVQYFVCHSYHSIFIFKNEILTVSNIYFVEYSLWERPFQEHETRNTETADSQFPFCIWIRTRLISSRCSKRKQEGLLASCAINSHSRLLPHSWSIFPDGEKIVEQCSLFCSHYLQDVINDFHFPANANVLPFPNFLPKEDSQTELVYLSSSSRFLNMFQAPMGRFQLESNSNEPVKTTDSIVMDLINLPSGVTSLTC